MNAITTNPIRKAALAVGLLVGFALGCDKPGNEETTDPDVQMRSVINPPQEPKDWCDVYSCEVCSPEGCPPGGHEVTYCCPHKGECTSSHQVPDGTLCPEGKFLVICHWGMTNVDGSFTCYDDA